MEQITNNWQIKDTNELMTTLFRVYTKLGERNRVAKKVVERLAEKCIIVAISTVYDVIYGRSRRADITEQFFNVATEMLAHIKDLQARIAALASAE